MTALVEAYRAAAAALDATRPAWSALVPDDSPLGPAWGLFAAPVEASDATRPERPSALGTPTTLIPAAETATHTEE